MSWVDRLQDDAGWNRPYLNDEDLIPRKYKTLRTKVIEKNLVCVSNGNTYIFIATLNKWSILCSDEATICLNSLIDMDSASVNYDKAFRPYVTFIERNATDNMASPVPTSIYIGTNRLRVSVNGDYMKLTKCEPLLVENPSYSRSSAIPSLCFMPLSIGRWPLQWQRIDDFNMYKFMAPLFPNPIELKTIEWAIGNSLIDLVMTSKAVILYGEGGIGKSTMLTSIKTALIGCYGSILDKALVRLSKGINTSVASVIVSNRVVIASDVGGYGDSTNLSIIKSLTGHDYISIPPLSAKSSCSLFYATNRLDDPTKNPKQMTSAIIRRVIVVLMNVDAISYTTNTVPLNSISRLDFALRCIHTRLSYPSMLVSPMSVVLTLAGELASRIMPYIIEEEANLVTKSEGAEVLSIVVGALGIKSRDVGELACRISSSTIKEVKGMCYLISIYPTNEYHLLCGKSK